MSWFNNAWVLIGNISKNIAVPFLLACVLIRAYIYIGYKIKMQTRLIKFFDACEQVIIDEYIKENSADIVNFKNKEK